MSEKKSETNAVVQEESFDVAEISANAERLFGYSPDIASAAFAFNGIKRATLSEARKTIKQFAERKV